MRLESAVPVTVRKLAVPLAIAACLLSPSVSAVTVDGNLADLQLAISGEPLPWNQVIATESGADAESNGFDITNGYAWYEVATDTFFIGMTFAGQVGTAGGLEGGFSPACNLGQAGSLSGNAGVFDGCETYGFNIDVNADSSVEYDLRMRGDAIANSGEGTEGAKTLTNDVLGLGLGAADWAISETSNGVEFSLTGLQSLLAPYGINNPRDVRIGLFAGTLNNIGPEDFMYMDMQVVPVPAAVWLFGSGLAALLGFTARKRSQLG